MEDSRRFTYKIGQTVSFTCRSKPVRNFRALLAKGLDNTFIFYGDNLLRRDMVKGSEPS